MFIIYSGANEIIVTSLEHEHTMLAEYFGPDMGRDLDEYDREKSDQTTVTFISKIKREW